MSFLTAMVSGLMRGGSQASAPSAATGTSDARIEEVVTQTENVTLEETAEESRSMDIDGVTPNEEPVHVLDETHESSSAPTGSAVTARTEMAAAQTLVRPSSVPLEREAAQMPRFGYVYDVRMMNHAPVTSSNHEDHPEQPARIAGIYMRLRNFGCLLRMKHIPIRPVRKMEAMLVHSEDHWEKVQMIARMDSEQIAMSEAYYEFLSLYVCPSTTMAAQLSCGGVIEAALAVARGELEKSFAIVRPPGHHAEPEEHMGFCFFNNVAVAARVVQQLTPLKRILILDWDVHQGNGTQRAFNDDPSVLYISIHRYENGIFYPGGPFGGLDSCGEGAGEGTSVNIPWPEAGMGDAEYIHAFTRIVIPIAMQFAPELVIISAGFDAADGDDLGECHVTPAGYAMMTHMLSSLAGGKLVVALEGGYNVESISNSALAVTRVLLGDAPPELKPVVANEAATETVWLVAKRQHRYWQNLDVTSCEPREEYPEQTLSIPELLKIHRQEYLYREYQMVQVPLLDTEVEERYQSQVICSQDVMDKDTLVLLVHQFGNLLVEVAGAMVCDVQLEHSYLLDVTKRLVEWVRQKGYAYAEINTYPRPPQPNHRRSWSELAREVVSYLWDNYILLSQAKKIVLIGHGPECQAVMDLLSTRVQTVMDTVQAVVLIVGREDIPSIPRHEDELRDWYTKSSFVAAPLDHELNIEGKIRKKHGKVKFYNEKKRVKILSHALPDITSFIESKLS
ncbi:histone deacetylase clr3 [Fomitiporia mediterranea MF3/22]|uniref:histone deacetylase clr3 n=1 Tax=Fomitiporia mediterranea (strain MF3/22) TaxID=694068 RepID=UPI000440832C|nr:histone deacetylase clr3 [Fomitiporia mediterranea MF3/22]EJD05919.1 histone deacetylase clr3 [Fomitiporia mediterranea MF3/22]